ncbi:cytochrome d ubiquinol oxidase subunit II [Calothrix sp. UHCC 0171]|uniref:cytochrome d ubiquinol oxidase subunit II n=1 Tax=Calothrix sp. UHCC 0171 TaxID=3110245 RepID=UPI002B1EB8CE|nr:cytochrome d ubiquinol oxidase subunit II [Calothrix sp. UHCC 0171]MEA5574402.1 cytochrome d ubiquinol oxidase subunit II [Calothrix sp. UHCC 0171]
MEAVNTTLPLLWFGLVALFLSLYLITDGFDLGVGILTLTAANEERRGIIINTLSTVWDANETWLVCTGGLLYGAFPLAYATIMNALYIPITLMVIGFIFRAVAFEFREHSINKTYWNWGFGGGSLLVAFSQGLVLGGVIAGIKVDASGNFIGGTWDWLNLPSILVALTVVQGYVLIGSTYLISKTEGELKQYHYTTAKFSAITTFLGALALTFAAPMFYESIRNKVFHQPELLIFEAIPFIATGTMALLMSSLNRRQEKMPFVWTIAVFLITILSLAFVVFPYIIPFQVTIYQASSSLSSQTFMIAFIGFFVPIILFYNAYLYRVFQGKVISPHYGE